MRGAGQGQQGAYASTSGCRHEASSCALPLTTLASTALPGQAAAPTTSIPAKIAGLTRYPPPDTIAGSPEGSILGRSASWGGHAVLRRRSPVNLLRGERCKRQRCTEAQGAGRPWTQRQLQCQQLQCQQPAASDRRAAWQVALRMRPRGGLTGEALVADKLLSLLLQPSLPWERGAVQGL